jgi:hypothetical protein
LRSVALLFTWMLLACGDGIPQTVDAVSAQSELTAASPSDDIRQRLQAIPGMRVVQEKSVPGNSSVRFFVLEYEQPADHNHPERERFRQRMTLLHRSAQAPMVLANTGYMLYSLQPYNTEPSYLLNANMLMVEHRFFGTSFPAARDWKLLDIQQAAADHHRIVQALKPLYPARWLSTGSSKGGMTALYHRYFYPNDVHATVAYVAPSMHFDGDPRFVDFLENVGTEDCRERLRQVQRALLSRRAEMQPFIQELIAAGYTFEGLGLERSYEFAVLEAPFTYWQYGPGVAACTRIPAPNAPAEELYAFLSDINYLEYYSDQEMEPYAAFYYQSATQLGSPRYPEAHLRTLLRYPGQDVTRNYLPYGVEKEFDRQAMRSVERWVHTRAERVLLVYGENDPWTTGAMKVNPANDSARYFAPGVGHGADIYGLSAPERSHALQQLSTWMGVPLRPYPSAQALVVESEELPVVNLALERRHRR